MNTVAFLTFAGFSGDSGKYKGIRDAAERLNAQAQNSKLFCFSKIVTWDDIKSYAKVNNLTLPHDPHIYLFTPILSKMAIDGFFGEANVFFYAGAGSEIVKNKFARIDFWRMVQRAKKNGFYVEGTRYKDESWCKKELTEFLESEESHLKSGQAQATFFLLSRKSEKAMVLATEWVKVSLQNNCHYFNEEVNPQIQSNLFIEPRFDQSIFSLLLKKHKIRIFREKRRGFGKFQALRGSNVFLHTLRNRTGTSKMSNSIDSFSAGLIGFLILPITRLHDFISDVYLVRKQYEGFPPQTIATKSNWP